MISAPVNPNNETAAQVATDARAQTFVSVGAKSEETSLLSVLTLVLWLSCLVVGSIGLFISYRLPQPPAKTPPPVQAEILNVQLTNDPLPPVDAPPPALDPTKLPPLQDPLTPPQAPAVIPVAQPTAAVAFALPVTGPTRVVAAKEASYAQTPAQAHNNSETAPAPQILTYGQGDGKQPAPEYPHRARREGQEGTVVVRFSVGENGHVIEAEAIRPCAWGLLNEAATKVVREQWRFKSGTVRLYEVAMRFKLKN